MIATLLLTLWPLPEWSSVAVSRTATLNHLCNRITWIVSPTCITPAAPVAGTAVSCTVRTYTMTPNCIVSIAYSRDDCTVRTLWPLPIWTPAPAPVTAILCVLNDPYLYGLQRLLQGQLAGPNIPPVEEIPHLEVEKLKDYYWFRQEEMSTVKSLRPLFFFQVKWPHLWLRPVLINFKYLSILTSALYLIYVLRKVP